MTTTKISANNKRKLISVGRSQFKKICCQKEPGIKKSNKIISKYFRYLEASKLTDFSPIVRKERKKFHNIPVFVPHIISYLKSEVFRLWLQPRKGRKGQQQLQENRRSRSGNFGTFRADPSNSVLWLRSLVLNCFFLFL